MMWQRLAFFAATLLALMLINARSQQQIGALEAKQTALTEQLVGAASTIKTLQSVLGEHAKKSQQLTQRADDADRQLQRAIRDKQSLQSWMAEHVPSDVLERLRSAQQAAIGAGSPALPARPATRAATANDSR